MRRFLLNELASPRPFDRSFVVDSKPGLSVVLSFTILDRLPDAMSVDDRTIPVLRPPEDSELESLLQHLHRLPRSNVRPLLRTSTFRQPVVIGYLDLDGTHWHIHLSHRLPAGVLRSHPLSLDKATHALTTAASLAAPHLSLTGSP